MSSRPPRAFPSHPPKAGMDELAIRNVDVVCLRPGDTLLVRLDQCVTEKVGKRIKAIVKKQIPSACGVMVIGPGVSLSIVRPQS